MSAFFFVTNTEASNEHIIVLKEKVRKDLSNLGFLCQILIVALYNPLLVKKLEEHLEKDPSSKSFCSLAQIYHSKGDLEKAEKVCLEGLIYNPSYSQAYVVLGEIYRSQGKIKKAIKCFIQAKECNPDNPNIYKNLGEIYKKQNDIEKTLNAYKMMAFLKPGDKMAMSTVQHLEKMVVEQWIVPSQTEGGKKETKAFSKTLSERESQKLSKLNKILAHVEIYIDKQSIGV